MIFAITRRTSFLKPATDKYSQKSTRRILELAENLDLTIYALVDHAETCPDDSVPDESDPIDDFLPAEGDMNYCHPTERQKKFCYFAKCMLAHAKGCNNKPCPAEYCQAFKDIIEYRFLFSRLKN
jgi:hypothetical protein